MGGLVGIIVRGNCNDFGNGPARLKQTPVQSQFMSQDSNDLPGPDDHHVFNAYIQGQTDKQTVGALGHFSKALLHTSSSSENTSVFRLLVRRVCESFTSTLSSEIS
jgi:hypothetical protein